MNLIVFEGHPATPFVWTPTSGTTRFVGLPLCPDLLCFEDLGVADTLRGRVVRAVFWLLRWWPTSPRRLT
jgi:hypothetical protein